MIWLPSALRDAKNGSSYLKKKTFAWFVQKKLSPKKSELEEFSEKKPYKMVGISRVKPSFGWYV